MERYEKALGAGRVLFGTDYPFRKMTVIISMYELGIGPEISESDFDRVMGENAEKLFSL
jgi:predicted TIM-barrel fold metal-dependent hydrolase